MKKLLSALFTAALLAASPLGAQDAEYLELVKEYTLNKDGSYDYHFRKELKLLTYYSFQRLYGETFIVYNPQHQQLKINEAYTVMADGKKVVTPPNAFNEVLPGFAHDVAAYNHLREMVVTHTATEIGAVITLDYTIHTDANYLPFLFGMEEIGEAAAVKALQIVLRVPESVNLQYRMLNDRTAPMIVTSSGQKTYTWAFRDLPALPRTPDQDPERKALLQFSTGRDMAEACFRFADQPAFRESLGTGARKRAASAVKDKADDLDKILALQETVIDEVKPADIPLAYTGYLVRPPQEVWQSANGTALEKAILLSRMLTAVGINAYPVATAPNGWFSRDLADPAVFDGFLVQVNPKKLGRIYLSVTRKQSQNLIYDLLDKTIVLLDPAMESLRTFQEKPETNLLRMDADLKVTADKEISGDLELETEGIVNPFFKIRKDSSYVKGMIAGDFAASRMGAPKIGTLTELKTRAEIGIPAAPVKADYNGYLFLELPVFNTGFDSWGLYQFTGSDNTPVKFGHHLWEEYRYEIEIPDGFSMVTPPTDVYFKNILGVLSIRITQNDRKISVYREFELSHDVITGDNMDEFKQMAKAWENENWRKIVLKKDQP